MEQRQHGDLLEQEMTHILQDEEEKIEQVKYEENDKIEPQSQIYNNPKYKKQEFIMKNESLNIKIPTSQYSLKKLYQANLSKWLKKLQQNKLSIQDFQFKTLMTLDTIQYLKNLQSFPNDKQLNILTNQINNIIRINRSYFSKKQELLEQRKLLDTLQKYQINMRKLAIQNHIQINWKNLNKYLIPEMMNMTLYSFLKEKNYKEAALRVHHGYKKRLQIEYLCYIVDYYIKNNKEKIKHIIDFAGGRGDYGIMLAYLYPDIKFTIADIKKQSLIQVKYRAKQIGLKNVRVYCGDIAGFNVPFDLAVGLHSCGALTDIILQKCKQLSKDFIICTCCFGKIKFWADQFKYPKIIQEINQDQYFEICKIAESEDYVFSWKQQDQEEFDNLQQTDLFFKNIKFEQQDDLNFNQTCFEVSKVAKQIINSDRLRFQSESQNIPPQNVQIIEIPKQCSFKNQVLISFNFQN